MHSKGKIYIIIGVVLVVLAVEFIPHVMKKPNIYLIPQGYTGWIEVHYGLPEYPPLPEESGKVLLRIPETGMLKTSSEPTYGLINMYYIDTTGNRTEIPADQRHGGSIGDNGTVTSERFYIGTKEQFEKWLKENGKLR